MFCVNCGSEIPQGAKFCTTCGFPVGEEEIAAASSESENEVREPEVSAEQTDVFNTSGSYNSDQSGAYSSPSAPEPYVYNQVPPVGEPNPSIYNAGLIDAIKSFFTRYIDFSGRSSRSEYWFAFLFLFGAGLVLGALAKQAGGIFSVLSSLFALGTLIPNLAICIRRLHDIGKSGWYYLMCLIPLVGIIIVIYYFCLDSQGPNQYGPEPAYKNKK